MMIKNVICVIDDDPLCQHLMKKLIARTLLDHELLQFENGDDALDFFSGTGKITTNLPQLIFIDINMPVLNGWQFLEGFEALKIKDYFPAMYIASSSCDQVDIDRASDFKQLQGYLIKPIRPLELSTILQTVYRVN